jgi:hypothetical protein
VEIKILITKQNKERILKLIDALVEVEAEGATTSSQKEVLSTLDLSSSERFIKGASDVGEIGFAEASIEQRKFGSWGMFNSYVPGKAALRVLLHLLTKSDGKAVKYWDLINECIVQFWKSGLRARGFPKRTSDSAKSRLAMHLIWPYHEMGLLSISGEKSDPMVSITRDGFEFANLPNPSLDRGEKDKPLSSEERKWLLTHLERIDAKGYKELTIFEDLVAFLSERDRHFEDIVDHVKANSEFESWVLNGSRHKNSPKAFARQMENIARSFASGKIALLRELGIVSPSRATYKIIGHLETVNQPENSD